jgi:hypothetical protein
MTLSSGRNDLLVHTGSGQGDKFVQVAGQSDHACLIRLRIGTEWNAATTGYCVNGFPHQRGKLQNDGGWVESLTVP